MYTIHYDMPDLKDNIYIIFLQHLCKKIGVQGLNLQIPRTEPAGLVLQGPVQGSAVCLNRTISPVQGSGKMSFELDQTGPWHHYKWQTVERSSKFNLART